MTRDEVRATIKDNLLKKGLEDIKTALATKFYMMEEAIEALYWGILAEENVILYGPGGYGKTELVKAFIEYTQIPSATLIGYEDMDVEALMGLPDIKMMLDKSEYKLSFDRSIFKNPGVLILEEFLDVNPRTAMALKDVLTEGGLRQGTDFYESLITSVVICTNKAPKELNFDKSSAAFYIERFPITVEVSNNFTALTDYQKLIKIMLGKKPFRDEHKILAELAIRTSKTQLPISPRTLKYALHLLEVADYDLFSLLHISSIDTSDINTVAAIYKINNETKTIESLEVKVLQELHELLATSTTYRSIIDNIAVIHKIITKLEVLSLESDDNVIKISSLISKCNTAIESLWESVKIDDSKINNIFNDTFE